MRFPSGSSQEVRVPAKILQSTTTQLFHLFPALFLLPFFDQPVIFGASH